jgi:CRP/FNR family transcriptional regulator, transcriptional activator FtrB
MPVQRIEAIRSIPLFADISDDSFTTLTRGAYVQNFPPHTDLIAEGETADFLHIVQSGRVELFSTWADRETSVSTLYENSTFILAATIKDRPNLMGARTLGKSCVIMIPSQDVRDVFETDPAFAKSIVIELARCYRATIKNMKNLKLRSSVERVANYILKVQRRGDGTLEFTLPIEKRQIASYLGMTPENLSRSFKSLKPYGVVIKGQQVQLTNLDKLTVFANPSDLIDR